MATNPKLRYDLLEILGITKQGLSYRAKKIKETHGPMTTEEAVYVIAHMEGLDLSKYLPISTLDRIRALVPRISPTKSLDRSKASTNKTHRIATKRNTSYPLVRKSYINAAKTLGDDCYPLLFLIENSIRELITLRLAIRGSNWWDHSAPKNVQQNVQRTISKEKRYPYRDKRGSHPIFYANFLDLRKVIDANRGEFQDVIIDFDWFKAKMDEIYMVRNNLAHCVPLSKDDITRINLFFRDWARLMENAGIK
jgi:hypothetical protein